MKRHSGNQRYHSHPSKRMQEGPWSSYSPREGWMGKWRPSKEKGLAQRHPDLQHRPPASQLKALSPETQWERGRDEGGSPPLQVNTPPVAFCPQTHRLPLAPRVSQNPAFARMPLKGRELRVKSPLDYLLLPHSVLGQQLTFTPCSPWGPFTPAGQLVGHYKENPTGLCGHRSAQTSWEVLPQPVTHQSDPLCHSPSPSPTNPTSRPQLPPHLPFPQSAPHQDSLSPGNPHFLPGLGWFPGGPERSCMKTDPDLNLPCPRFEPRTLVLPHVGG